VQIEDLLVSLADAWWRGKRDCLLEDAVCAQIALQTGSDEWGVFAAMHDIATAITAQADKRLQWQSRFPIG
jgi:hypothetical protein